MKNFKNLKKKMFNGWNMMLYMKFYLKFIKTTTGLTGKMSQTKLFFAKWLKTTNFTKSKEKTELYL